jgi:aspartyl-tRNA(Asn)/glutamyl-tRNA(Gln) amidotransferase subunit A
VLKATQLSQEELRLAYEVRVQLRQEFDALFAQGISAIVSPGREDIADTLEHLASNPTGWRGSCTRMYGMAGLPALVMPMGFGAQSMPLGIQIAANRFDEDIVYQVAAAYEGETKFNRHPPI